VKAIYGNSFYSFPERFERVKYFSQEPALNGGYGNQKDLGTVKGVFQNKTKGVKDSNGNLVMQSIYEMWTEQNLVKGNFLEREEIVYRIMSDAEYEMTGGFNDYQLEKVVGLNGEAEKKLDIDLGGGEFQ
jgi:hypothetical protein